MRRVISWPCRYGLALLLGAGATGVGCAHSDGSGSGPEGSGPPIETEVEVTGLKQEERDVLEQNVCALPRVETCQLTVQGDRALLGFTYRGTLHDLQGALAELPHPGLDVQKATARLVYQGFDNIPPEMTVRGPAPGSVHTVSDVEVTIDVVATDIKVVRVGDVEAVRIETDEDRAAAKAAKAKAKAQKSKSRKGKKSKKSKKGKKAQHEPDDAGPTTPPSARGTWVARLQLEDGRQTLAVRAIDDAGNEAKADVPVIVDTTPPVLAVTVQIKGLDRATLTGQVEGAAKVLVDGQEVSIGSFGRFHRDMPADPDKKTSEVVAVDEHGNQSALKVDLVAGFAASAGGTLGTEAEGPGAKSGDPAKAKAKAKAAP